MKSRQMLHAAVLSVLCLVMFHPAIAQPKYTITDLGTLGGSASFAYGINNSGHVIGYANEPGNLTFDAFYYDGTLHNLGTALGKMNTVSTGINDSNQVTGWTIGEPAVMGFIWDPINGIKSIGIPYSEPVAINNLGQIAGVIDNGLGGLAFTLDPVNGEQIISALPGFKANQATGINDSGVIVGYNSYLVTGAYQATAFIWDRVNGARDMGLGGIQSYASGINNNGHVVGSWASSLGVGRAFVWNSSTGMSLLPLVVGTNGTANTDAYAINSHDQVVGMATMGSQYAVLFSGSTAYLLDDLIPPNSGWHLIEALGINDVSQIAGYGVINGQTHAFRLDPVTDTTPPLIVPQVSGTLGLRGWYVSDLMVSWAVSDPESGIASSTGCATTNLTTDTAGVTLTCSATNGAGLSSLVSVTIKIDKTPPVISGMPVPGCTLWPPDHKLVQIATVTAADALSGLAPGSFMVTGTSNDPANGQIVITSGPSQFNVQLGADKDEVYTLRATASDLAGNTITQQATCTVPHDQGH